MAQQKEIWRIHDPLTYKLDSFVIFLYEYLMDLHAIGKFIRYEVAEIFSEMRHDVLS